MPDTYVEFNTTIIPVPRFRIIVRNLFVAAGILFIIYSVIFYPILWTVSVLFFVIAYYYNRGNTYEYEYIILNDDMHVDKIIANLKRKKAYRANLANLELFTDDPKEVDEIAKRGRKMRIKNYYHPKSPIFYVVLRNENKYDILEINADEKLIDAIALRHPLQTKIKNPQKKKKKQNNIFKSKNCQ